MPLFPRCAQSSQLICSQTFSLGLPKSELHPFQQTSFADPPPFKINPPFEHTSLKCIACSCDINALFCISTGYPARPDPCRHPTARPPIRPFASITRKHKIYGSRRIQPRRIIGAFERMAGYQCRAVERIVLRDEAVALLVARAQVHISDLEHVVLVFVLSGSPLASGRTLFRNDTGDGK